MLCKGSKIVETLSHLKVHRKSLIISAALVEHSSKMTALIMSETCRPAGVLDWDLLQNRSRECKVSRFSSLAGGTGTYLQWDRIEERGQLSGLWPKAWSFPHVLQQRMGLARLNS